MTWKIGKVLESPEGEKHLLMVKVVVPKQRVYSSSYSGYEDHIIPKTKTFMLKISESQLASLVDVIDPGWQMRIDEE